MPCRNRKKMKSNLLIEIFFKVWKIWKWTLNPPKPTAKANKIMFCHSLARILQEEVTSSMVAIYLYIPMKYDDFSNIEIKAENKTTIPHISNIVYVQLLTDSIMESPTESDFIFISEFAEYVVFLNIRLFIKPIINTDNIWAINR